MNKTLALALLVFACLARGFAQSDIVYVAYNGADTHPCTRVSPCQTITHALSVVNAGGQVIIVGSGTYDNFTITKAVTVAAEPGVIAVLDVTNSDTGITVNAGTNDRVVVRGLYLNGHGVQTGIEINSAGEVSLEDCVARNFNIALFSAAGNAVFVTVKGGVYASAPLSQQTSFPSAIWMCCEPPFGTPGFAAIDSVTIEGGCFGVLADGVVVTVTNSTLSGGTVVDGICQQSVGITVFSGTAISGNNVISNYKYGVISDGGTLYLSSNTIAGNGTGVDTTYGPVFTRGNNTIVANDQNVSGTMTPFSGQ